MERTRRNIPLSTQMKEKVTSKKPDKKEYDGDFGKCISTGSTLLDLAISGGQIRGGGLPGGILVEIFGPSGSGKTVLLSEIAGTVQREGGEAIFKDPEARLNKQFAQLFGLEVNKDNYSRPKTVPEVFKTVRDWEPENPKVINGIFADSLAALSTDQEMEKEEGDKMGMRRAKEFSEELRKTCRIIAEKNFLMVCSNQVRVNIDAGPYGQKYITPGGEAIGFYSSLRLRVSKPEKIKEKRKIAGKEVVRVSGVEVQIEVFKSSIWKPFRIVPVTIGFDYGIDNTKDSLQFIKDHTNHKVYTCQGEELSNSMEEAIRIIEGEEGGIQILRQNVIRLWEEIESKFETDRKPKRP
jgi:recombination protein RecA